MLPPISLSFSDTATFNPLAPPAAQLPEAAIVPQASFAEQLKVRFSAVMYGSDAGGELLPPGGSTLPVAGEVPTTTRATDFEIDTKWLDLAPEASADVIPIALPQTAIPAVPVVLADTFGRPLPEGRSVPAAALNLQPASIDPEVTITTARQQPFSPVVAKGLAAEQRPASGASPDNVVPLRAATTRTPEVQAVPAVLRGYTAVAERAPKLAATDVIKEGPIGGPKASTPQSAPIQVSGTGLEGLAAQAVTQPQRFVGAREQPLPVPLEPVVDKVAATRITSLPDSVLQVSQPPAPSSGILTASGVTTSVSLPIPVPVQSDAWGEQVGARVLMMAGNDLKSASIRLTPAELGPMQIKVTVDDGVASVHFQAHHSATREAIEMALPRLREMLAEQGISLGQTNVGDHGISQGKDQSGNQAAAATPIAGSESDELDNAAELQSGNRPKVPNGLIDTFA